jgi:DNA-binding protein HU-beta
MTHRQLLTVIHRQLKGAVTIKDIDSVLDALAKAIAEEIATGEIVTIKDIGSFTALSVKARMGVNPKTGEKILLPASKRVKLKPCVHLKNEVNQLIE